ncbi:MAG: hypothetical protein K2I25_06100, partial [Muribaculaceae bacterium]|nr:hypothetical protein [Muribaculaceae bacterium]
MIKIKGLTVAVSLMTAALTAGATDVRIITSTPESQWTDGGVVEYAAYDNTCILYTSDTAE